MQQFDQEQFRGFMEPKVIAAGRLLAATATVVGTPEWSGIVAVTVPTGIHPGFAAAIVDNGVGDYTVTTNFDLTTLTCVVIATCETLVNIVSAVRATATTIRLTSRAHGGALVESDIDIMVLGV
jgi:hypothetical protein